MGDIMHQLHKDCDPAGKEAADKADHSLSLAHHTAEAEKASGFERLKCSLLAACRDAAELDKTGIWLGMDDLSAMLDAASIHLEDKVRAVTPEQRAAAEREHFDSMADADARFRGIIPMPDLDSLTPWRMPR
jgi:hypothetical protein